MVELSSYQTACTIAGILDEKKATDIVILDIGKVSILADYFVICSTDTSTQLRALGEVLTLELKQKYSRTTKNEQRDKSGKWFLYDYGDVVIHILHKEAREFYAIEKFWSHAFVVEEEKWLEEYKQVKELNVKISS